MSFFTQSITDKELFSLQIKINKLLLDCQKRLDYIKTRTSNPQKYAILKRQVFDEYSTKIEIVLKEFRE